VSHSDADERGLLRAIELARLARAHGNQPFGALLVDVAGPDVLEAENTVLTARDWLGHAELNVVRAAGPVLGLGHLGAFTLYASTEPCAMCAAAAYLAGVGRVVYALGADAFRELAGEDSSATVALSCREVLGRGGRRVEVSGPHLELEARAVHDGFW
jgi:tRNA(Arg) A34 adenosine deaminase TadA